MPSRKRRSTARRSDFVEGEDFAKAIYFGGGPGFGEIDDLAHLPGEYGEVMRAVWGSSQAEFEAEVEAQYQREQEERRQVLVKKWKERGHRKAPGRGKA